MKEKIKFLDAYGRGNFSPPYEAVGLPLEGGWAVMETTYRKRKVSSGAELGALSSTSRPVVRNRLCHFFDQSP